jgi:hypothetical protein
MLPTARWLLIVLCLSSSYAFAAKEEADDIQAKTPEGDEVILHSNGYWEFKDAKKAAVAKVKVEEFEHSNGCPIGMRPSFLGMGRCISYDDPLLKRGSLSGKGR